MIIAPAKAELLKNQFKKKLLKFLFCYEATERPAVAGLMFASCLINKSCQNVFK